MGIVGMGHSVTETKRRLYKSQRRWHGEEGHLINEGVQYTIATLLSCYNKT